MKKFVDEDIILEQLLSWPREKVFLAMTAEIGSWWNHRFKEGSTVGFEPRIGGRFYEDFGGGSAALYAVVTYIEPPSRFRLEGSMGMEGALVSVMDFELETVGSDTMLTLVHSILGRLEEGLVEEYGDGWKESLGKALPAWLAKKG